MPRFLIEASYGSEGAKGIAKDGGSKRKTVVGEMVKKAGGTVHSFDFAFGSADAYIIVEMPDIASALALSLAVNSAGAVFTGLMSCPPRMSCARAAQRSEP